MSPDRRAFLKVAGSCAAHLALVGGGGGAAARRLFAATGPEVVTQEEPWGRLVGVADGVWALVSTPLEDRTTLCNGGIVAGTAGTVVFEAFASPAGATWMARRARALTGRWPDHVVVSHHHGDHSGGLAGYAMEEVAGAGPALRATAATRDRVRESAEDKGLLRALESVSLLPDEPTTLDLGGRSLRLEALNGHTASDVVARIDDPPVLFCGDLVWNGMFPNYVDARPSALSASVARVADMPAEVWVPGHGTLADAGDLGRYRELLGLVEEAAREAVARGASAAEAGEAFTVPGALGEWYRFSPAYPARAIAAWMAELTGAAGASTP